ncbi:hypothetical protein ABT095_11305 [Kitasatospora sp. NPDC002227]|uniref:hypothetical protein n=1 Tax=Kitasatospora sp. NPDC002227 TaxID=3154773 RepID=UPI00331AF824
MDETTVPTRGMRVSVRTRQDVVIADPELFLAAARQACRELNPDADEEAVAEEVRDVHDAVFTLLERHGGLAASLLEPQVLPRQDGLSAAGEIMRIVLDDPMPLKDYGCFLPEDPFALPPGA